MQVTLKIKTKAQSNSEAAITVVQKQLKTGSLQMVKETNTAMEENSTSYTPEKALEAG